MTTPSGRQFCVVFFRPSGQAESPAEKEYHDAVRQPKERAKIEALLQRLALFGFKTPGIAFEKVKGAKANIYELKIKAFGSEHRFLAGYASLQTREGLPVMVLLKGSSMNFVRDPLPCRGFVARSATKQRAQSP